MNQPITQQATDFPPPPVASSALLVPITSWPDMYRETAVTGVEFDLFWYDSVQEGVAYFFSWLGNPRATILVVWDDAGLTHIECRTGPDRLASPAEVEPMLAAVTQAFRDADFWWASTTQ